MTLVSAPPPQQQEPPAAPERRRTQRRRHGRLRRFGDGSDNWPRPKRSGTASKRPWELDITSFTVADGVFHYDDDTVPMAVSADHVHVALLGMGGTDVQGRVVCESVAVTLPHS